MAHRMIVPDLFPPPDYAHAAVIEAGERLVLTAGAVPLDPDGNLVGVADYIAQTRQVLANLSSMLQATGSGLEHVVASTVYVVASEHHDLVRVWDVVRESELSAGPHTSTLLGVSHLGYAGQLVEITAVAVVASR